MVDIDKELGTPDTGQPRSQQEQQPVTSNSLLSPDDFYTYLTADELVKEIHKYKKRNNILKRILIKHVDIIMDIESELQRHERLLNLALDFKKNTLLPTETSYKDNIFSISTYNKLALTDKVIGEKEMHTTFTNIEDLVNIKSNLDKIPGIERGIAVLSDVADNIMDLRRMTELFDRTSVRLKTVDKEETDTGEIPETSVVELDESKGESK